LRAKQGADWEFIGQTIQTIADPRLRALCDAFLKDWGDRFAARPRATIINARRGGLVEHTQMMRVAKEIVPLYPELNLDLC
jgi:hypothetical protein